MTTITILGFKLFHTLNSILKKPTTHGLSQILLPIIHYELNRHSNLYHYFFILDSKLIWFSKSLRQDNISTSYRRHIFLHQLQIQTASNSYRNDALLSKISFVRNLTLQAYDQLQTSQQLFNAFSLFYKTRNMFHLLS